MRIVDGVSLAAAADAGGQSVASLVRSLAALEAHLGVRLLNRSTRRLALTDEGARYLAWCRQTLADFDDIEQQLASSDGRIAGVLRLTAPVEFGQRYLAPLVNGFLADHPALRVELSLNDRIVPLLATRIDLALRLGRLPDSGMIARGLGHTRLVTCASPAYLAMAPGLERPQAMQHRPCITLVAQGRDWHYRCEGDACVVPVVPRLVCDHIRTAVLAAVQGLGVVRLMHYQVADELADGRLVRLLRDFESEAVPVQWVYPHALAMAPRVKAFVDWAGPRLQAGLPDCEG